MKTIIFRKPKFMRSDIAMKTYVDIAESIGMVMFRPDLKPDELYEMLKKFGECINEAAKAGGFFSTKDFLKWAEIQRQR